MKRAIVALGVGGHLVFQVRPQVDKVRAQPGARDYSSYHYAVQAAAAGEDPYTPSALSHRSQAEGTRRMVQPYYYPPPFLLTVVWAIPLRLDVGYVVMAVLNELVLAATMVILYLRFDVAAWAIALLLATFSPVADNLWMGQANLLTMLPALVGIAWGRGAGIGTAAMFKMSPALLLLGYVRQRAWRSIGIACVTAVVLSILTLPLVGFAAQARFYTEVLPGFLRGEYHGLKIAISLPGNHSLADWFNRAWPGDAPTRLSTTAQLATRLGSAALLAAWGWLFRRDDRLAWSTLVVLMVMLPVYTFEHHLAMLLLPIGVLASRARSIPRLLGFGLVYLCLAPSMDTQLALAPHLPEAVAPLVRELKFFGMVGLLALGVAWRQSASEKSG